MQGVLESDHINACPYC